MVGNSVLPPCLEQEIVAAKVAEQFVVKVVGASEETVVTDFQIAALQHLEDLGRGTVSGRLQASE